MQIPCTQNCQTYNQSKAYIPLYYAYAAYCEEALLNRWNCKWCSQASDNFAIENVIATNYLQSFIGFDKNTNQIVISFRGTHNYEDWFTDLEYGQIQYPNVDNAYVHQGFYNAYKDITEKGLITSLQKLLSTHPNCTNILITGHSLGGALTELCALDLIDNHIIKNNTKITIYTFGCPRWANKYLAQYLNSLQNIRTNWRIVNKNDPVAIVPGKFLGTYGFYHTATEILYTNYWDDLKYIICDAENGEDPKCRYSLWSEEGNAHLWYFNIHENCGVNVEGQRPYHERASIPNDSNEYGTNLNVNGTHWMLSITLICIGFVTAIIYYIIVKIYQKRNGYKSISEVAKEEKERDLRKFNRKRKVQKSRKNIMKVGLLDTN